MSLSDDGWLTRKEAARFLSNQCDHPISPQTLANMACNNNAGDGPPFYRTGSRKTRWGSGPNGVFYKVEDLRAWAQGRVQRIE
jgi:hypothetical protein